MTEMFEALYKVLGQLTNISEKTKVILADFITVENYKEGEYFIKEGEKSDKVGFIYSGIFRHYYVNEKNEEITALFLMKGDFVVKLRSYFENTPSPRSIRAEQDCTILVISKEKYIQVRELVPDFELAIGKIANKVLNDINTFQRKIIMLEAEEKYIEFLKNYPGLINKVALGQVASYLGMTQSTLSRVRKKLVK